jgi:hypothetical protein
MKCDWRYLYFSTVRLVRISSGKALYVLLASHYIKYKSDIQKITPDTETTKAEGQGQYGRARWLRKKDIEKTFGVAKFDVNNKEIKRLTNSRYDDLNE